MDIITAEVIEGYTVHLRFKDRTQRTVDLEPYLRGPIFEPVHSDRDVPESVRVDSDTGTIVWPNGADLAPDVLHSGVPSARMEAAAHTKKSAAPPLIDDPERSSCSPSRPF